MSERLVTDKHLKNFHFYLLQEEKSAATVEKYLRDIRAFAVFADGRPVTKERTLEYKQSLIDRGYAVRSVNSMLASLNSFLRFLGWNDCTVKNIRFQQETYCAEEKELTREEYLRLLQASEDRPALRLLLQTICATGIRVSELKFFTLDAVRRGRISVRCKNKTRVILIPNRLRNRLLRYAERYRIHSGAIFVTRSGRPLDRSNIWTAMKSLCERAGISSKKVFPHNLRKLFARTFYNAEKDIAQLADILGHSSINTTRIYIMTTYEEHLRKIERLGLVPEE